MQQLRVPIPNIHSPQACTTAIGQGKRRDDILAQINQARLLNGNDQLQTPTGGITKFLAKENFRKILKASHFALGFSLDETCDEIKTSHRVSLEFSYSYRVLGVDSGGRPESEGSEESRSWVNGIHGRG